MAKLDNIAKTWWEEAREKVDKMQDDADDRYHGGKGRGSNRKKQANQNE